MKTFYKIFGLLLLIVFTSCSTVHVSTDYDRDVNFSQFKTFAFHQKGIDSLNLNDLDKRRISSAITNELVAKGMQNVTNQSSADLIVNISAKNKTKIEVESAPWYNPWWGYGPYWGSNYQQRVRKYKEGTIIIDFIDRQQNSLVWQGVGEGLNISHLEGKAEEIPAAIQEILAKYPPKK